MSVKPSNALKITESDQSTYLNTETYQYYLTRLMLMCTSLFKWEGLPETIPSRFIEKTLFNSGQVAFFKDEIFGEMVTKCTQFGELNHYDEPVAWSCYTSNGYWSAFKSEEVEIIRNNEYSIPTISLLNFHLKRLFNIERTIDSNLWQQRHLAILKTSENKRLTVENILREYDNHEYVVLANEDLSLKDSTDSLNFDIPFIGDKLEEMREKKWNDLINSLGINSANSSKRERLITDEANANNQLVQLSVDIMLAERQLAVERINKNYGTHISVSLRNEIEEINVNNKEGDDIIG